MADALPRAVVARLLTDETSALRRERFEALLDAGHGEGLLVRPWIGSIVENALLNFDGDRYRLHAWCVMPNHVHVLLTPLAGASLSSLIHSWKSFTAKAINAGLGRQRTVWFEEYFDRAIRDDTHFSAAKTYIEDNPVKAGLCTDPGDWVFSSGTRRRLDAHF